MTYKKELIGKVIVINGKQGKIIDETKHMLIVEHADKARSYQKGAIRFELGDEGIAINGKDIVARPEDRIKNGKTHRNGNKGKGN